MDANHPGDSGVTIAMHQVKLIVYTHTDRAPTRILMPTMPKFSVAVPQKVSVLQSLLRAKDRQKVLISTSSCDDFTATEATVCCNEPPSHINF